jgi:sulfur-oxidizing protein SoxB
VPGHRREERRRPDAGHQRRLSNGKFLGVLDFDVKNGKVADFRYKLLPVFANLLPADKEMDALIDKVRAPYEAKLNEKLAVTEGLLYRRGNFNGSWDQLISTR